MKSDLALIREGSNLGRMIILTPFYELILEFIIYFQESNLELGQIVLSDRSQICIIIQNSGVIYYRPTNVHLFDNRFLKMDLRTPIGQSNKWTHTIKDISYLTIIQMKKTNFLRPVPFYKVVWMSVWFEFE